MKVFAQLSSSVDVKAICQAVFKKCRLLDVPWSTAELRLDNEDYNWLENYISNLDYCDLDRLLDGRWDKIEGEKFYNTELLGIVLLIYEAEVGRRKSTEGELWSAVYKQVPEAVRRTLFLSDGQPNAKHKEILEMAARRWRTRHVFGCEGVQEWMGSIYLQFGFTHRGFRNRLPNWLAGQGRPVAVKELYDSSQSFKKLWNALKSYSCGNLRAEQLQRVLNDSYWVLPQWHEELLEAASRRVKGSTGEVEEDTFLSPPKIVWDDECYFTTEIINLTEIGLVENEYLVNLNGKRVAKLLKQEDDSYYTQYFHKEDCIRIELQEEAYLAITDRQGAELKSICLELFKKEDEITAYNLRSGMRVDISKGGLKSDSAYILIVNDDIDLLPSVKGYVSGDVKALRLEESWLADTKILIDGEELCQLKEYVVESSIPEWTQEVNVSAKGSELHLDKSFYIRVNHPEDVQVISARCAGKKVSPTEQARGKNYTDLGPFTLSFDTASEPLWIRVRLKRGNERCSLKRDLHPRFVNPMFKSGDYEIELDESAQLNANQFSKGRIKFFPSVFKNFENPTSAWSLLQGRCWITSLNKSGEQVIGTQGFVRLMPCMGASLKLVDSIYNSQNTLRLASSVIDTGVVKNVEVQDGRVRIELFYEIEPDQNHSVVLLSNTVLKVAPEFEAGLWSVEIPEDFQPIALAIAYGGEWLGNWSDKDWATRLNPLNEEEALKVAWFLKWMRLPVISNAVKDKIKRFFESYPKAVARAWLTDYSEGGLVFTNQENWLLAMNKVLGYLTINTSTAMGIFEALREANFSNPMEEFKIAAKKLIDIDPIIAGWILRIVLKEDYLSKGSLGEVKRLMQVTIEEIASVGKEELLKQCAGDMRVDSYFAKDSIKKAVGFFLRPNESVGNKSEREARERDKRNFTISICTSRPYRELLGIKILEEIRKELCS